MYLAKKLRVTLIFSASDAKCSIDLWSEMGWNDPLHSSGSVGACMS